MALVSHHHHHHHGVGFKQCVEGALGGSSAASCSTLSAAVKGCDQYGKRVVVGGKGSHSIKPSQGLSTASSPTAPAGVFRSCVASALHANPKTCHSLAASVQACGRGRGHVTSHHHHHALHHGRGRGTLDGHKAHKGAKHELVVEGGVASHPAPVTHSAKHHVGMAAHVTEVKHSAHKQVVAQHKTEAKTTTSHTKHAIGGKIEAKHAGAHSGGQALTHVKHEAPTTEAKHVSHKQAESKVDTKQPSAHVASLEATKKTAHTGPGAHTADVTPEAAHSKRVIGPASEHVKHQTASAHAKHTAEASHATSSKHGAVKYEGVQAKPAGDVAATGPPTAHKQHEHAGNKASTAHGTANPQHAGKQGAVATSAKAIAHNHTSAPPPESAKQHTAHKVHTASNVESKPHSEHAKQATGTHTHAHKVGEAKAPAVETKSHAGEARPEHKTHSENREKHNTKLGAKAPTGGHNTGHPEHAGRQASITHVKQETHGTSNEAHRAHVGEKKGAHNPVENTAHGKVPVHKTQAAVEVGKHGSEKVTGHTEHAGKASGAHVTSTPGGKEAHGKTHLKHKVHEGKQVQAAGRELEAELRATQHHEKQMQEREDVRRGAEAPHVGGDASVFLDKLGVKDMKPAPQIPNHSHKAHHAHHAKNFNRMHKELERNLPTAALSVPELDTSLQATLPGRQQQRKEDAALRRLHANDREIKDLRHQVHYLQAVNEGLEDRVQVLGEDNERLGNKLRDRCDTTTAGVFKACAT